MVFIGVERKLVMGLMLSVIGGSFVGQDSRYFYTLMRAVREGRDQEADGMKE